MSIRERLQGLVELLENKEKPESDLVDEIEKIEELLTADEEDVEDVEEAEEGVGEVEIEPPEQVDLSPEEVGELDEFNKVLTAAQLRLGKLMYSYEIQKRRLINIQLKAEQDLQAAVETLREEKGLPDGVVYTLDMSQSDSGIAFFKKE